MRRLSVVFLVLIVCSLVIPSALAKKKRFKARDLLLPTSFTDVTEAQKKLTSVPGAEGASAVVLLAGELITWDEQLAFKRSHAHRRVKILTEAGIERYGDYRLMLWGDWRVKKIEARTILPDGTVIDAKENIFHEKSDSGDQVIRIAFPQVTKGAILDLYTEITSSAFFVLPWNLQESIPVLDSRFIMQPPRGLRYRTIPLRLPAEVAKPIRVPYGAGREAFIWRFENIQALPDVAFLPPVDDISQKFIVITESFKNSYVFQEIASNWKSYIKEWSDNWDEWLNKAHSQTDALAKQVAGEKTTAIEKAEAIRRALKQRMTSNFPHRWVQHDSPDEALAAGSGTSADIAGLTVRMLKAVGVEAHVAAIRRRSGGVIVAEIPIPALLDDVLVRLPGSPGVFFSATGNVPVGQLPWDCTGVLAVPYDGAADKPVAIADPKPEDLLIDRESQVTVHADGLLEGTTTFTYHAVAGEAPRGAYRNLDDNARKLRFQDSMRRGMSDLALTSIEFENLTNPSQDLVIKTSWQVPDYTTVAAKRLIINPNLFVRIDASDWAPENRQYDVDLRHPYIYRDRVSLTFPESTREIQTPGNADFNAGPVGFYLSKCETSGRTLTVSREMRLNFFRFPAASYAGLSRWFKAIAEADDRAAVVTLQ